MLKPFSKRNKTRPEALSYELPYRVRNRIRYTMQEIVDPQSMPGEINQWSGFSMFLEWAEVQIKREHGGFFVPRGARQQHTGWPTLDYVLATDDERFIDFIELFFQWREYRGHQEGVDKINGVLREEGIGYDFSPFVDSTTELDADPHYPTGTTSYRHEIHHYPQATKKSDEVVHHEVVMPTVKLLAGPDWESADDHMMKAHEHNRKGDYRSAITEAGSALESALKIVCQKKRWKYTPDKDVLSTLIDVGNREGLFFPFYVEVLKNCGTIRNRLGAHGKEPKPTFTADAAHAEHMIHLVSSHILFLSRLAGMR